MRLVVCLVGWYYSLDLFYLNYGFLSHLTPSGLPSRIDTLDTPSSHLISRLLDVGYTPASVNRRQYLLPSYPRPLFFFFKMCS